MQQKVKLQILSELLVVRQEETSHIHEVFFVVQ